MVVQQRQAAERPGQSAIGSQAWRWAAQRTRSQQEQAAQPEHMVALVARAHAPVRRGRRRGMDASHRDGSRRRNHVKSFCCRSKQSGEAMWTGKTWRLDPTTLLIKLAEQKTRPNMSMQQMCRCKFPTTRRATELARARPQNTKANVKVSSLLNYHQILYRLNAQHPKTNHRYLKSSQFMRNRGKGMYKPPSLQAIPGRVYGKETDKHVPLWV
jgi:hypothetical protein